MATSSLIIIIIIIIIGNRLKMCQVVSLLLREPGSGEESDDLVFWLFAVFGQYFMEVGELVL